MQTVKRAFDICFSLFGLCLLLPLLLIIGFAIKLTTPGPIFFRGVRAGRFGTPFCILKFRSMVVGAERGALSTSKNDTRVTRLGGYLRRYKFDEIPQLWNVLVGEMSIVGPRPEMLEYTRLYTGEENLILTVRPGITDYASLRFNQLSEILGDQDPDSIYEEQVRPIKNALRIYYVQQLSFSSDMKLIVRTLTIVLSAGRWGACEW
jgi:lipopolysaccharide/colanic/teichoic acid biosynthesis glycosyltransferase